MDKNSIVDKSKIKVKSNECSDNENDINKIDVVNNNIYFYDDITIKNILILKKELHSLETEILSVKNKYNLKENVYIYLYIRSYGGDIYAGLSGMNAIENCKVPIITIADGYVASAATFLLLGGSKRYMCKHSSVLIHQLSSVTWGKFQDISDEYINCKKLMKQMIKIYNKKTNMSIKQLNKIVKREIDMDTRKCKKYGIVHEII